MHSYVTCERYVFEISLNNAFFERYDAMSISQKVVRL